jgi:glucokinase
MPISHYALGLDLGGTAIKAAVVSDSGEVLEQIQQETPGSRAVGDVVAAIVDVVNRAVKTWSDIVGIGLGSPGLVDKKRRMIRSSPNFPTWVNVPLSGLISSRIERPIRLENDVNCFALGEYRWGAGRGFDPMLALAVGTGIGGGIILNGELYRGDSGAAGELGHISVDFNGPKCPCGGYGCVERYLGNRWFVEYARTALKDESIASPKDVSDLAEKGNKKALEFIQRQGEILGAACASLINIFDPQAIVIGGGTAQCGEPFFRSIRDSVKSRAYPELSQKVNILPAQLGILAGAMGAAAIGFEARRNK